MLEMMCVVKLTAQAPTGLRRLVSAIFRCAESITVYCLAYQEQLLAEEKTWVYYIITLHA
jgi:hypothetical protein